MAKNKAQSNFGLERERFSNFVVDLRRLEQAAAPKIKAEEKKISRRIFEQWGKVERSFQQVKPNLLAASQAARSSRIIFRRPKLDFSRWKKIISSAFTILAAELRARSSKASIQKNAWRSFIRSQERILGAPPKLKIASPRETASLERTERLETTETTAAWYRSLFTFALVLILIILPFKILSYFQLIDFKGWEAKIMGNSESALNNLMAAADSVGQKDFKGADSRFQAAGANFLAASGELDKINDSILILASLSSNEQLKMAAESKKFLTAGVIAASLGRNLVLATDSLFNGDKNDFPATLDRFLNYGHQAAKDAQDLKATVSRINPNNLPFAYRAKFISLNDQAALLADSLVNFVGLGDKLKEVLGVSRDKRYLVVFQNNSELRASGGFLGSYALVDLRDGKINNLEVPGGGSYDTEAGLDVRVAAPKPLWLVNTLWHFWDANWWPDWPTTAQHLMWFYEHSNGPSVDGVISVTPTVVERLLEVTGPIDLTKEYGLTITSDNFWQTVQLISERENLLKTNPAAVLNVPATSSPVAVSLPLKQGLENNSSNKPKKIIGDLLAKILEILPSKLDKDNLLKIITIFEENMSEKQILLYFTDPALEAEVESHNWAGEIQDAPKDYLLVVNTNIAGQKTDRLIKEKIEETSVVSPSGAIINTLIITRTHNGVKHEALTGVRNVDWLRVYVPAGSELLSAEGFLSPDAKYLQDRPDSTMENDPLLAAENSAAEDPSSGTKIYTEKGKTVFANWSMVDPGESVTITLQYRLPFNFFTAPADDSWLKRLNNWLNPDSQKLWPYSLLVQKQPGAAASDFQGRLVLPTGASVFWHYPENLDTTDGWEINDQLNADKYWSILVQKNK